MPKRQIDVDNAFLQEINMNPMKIMKATDAPFKERSGYGRKADSNIGIVEIFRQEIDGIRVYQCPFCDINPLASDIRFRKHLKLHHPTKKTLLKETTRPPASRPEPQDKIIKMIHPPELTLDTIFSQSKKSPTIKLQTRTEKAEVEVNSSKCYSIPDELSSRVASSADLVGSFKDLPNSPMLVIAQDPLVDQSEDNSDRDFTQENIFMIHTEQSNDTDRVNKTDFEPIAFTGLMREEDSVMVRRVEEDDEVEDFDLICSICGTSMEDGCHSYTTKSLDLEDGTKMETLGNVAESVLGGLPENSLICPLCEEVTSEIARTRVGIENLQRRLTSAVTRLVDLAILGKRLIEEDLMQGGVVMLNDSSKVLLSVLEPEGGRLNLSQKDFGLHISKQYTGKLLGEDDEVVDDGSSPVEVSINDELADIARLFVSQEDWASGGLAVLEGLVHIPSHLAAGVGLGLGGRKILLSRSLTQELPFPFFCLQCDKGFSEMGGLIVHTEKHHDVMNRNSREYDADDSYEKIEDTFDSLGEFEGINNVKGSKSDQKKISDLTESDKYKIELRSYMHKEQFKDCSSETPSLDKPFQCKECNKTFERAHDLWGHHASFRGPAFNCNFPNCHEVFLRLPDFAVHYSAHAGIVLEIPENSAEKKTLPITCPICHTVVPGLYKLQRHKMKHDPELKYKCPACPKQFVKANTLRMHITNVHKSKKPRPNAIKCGICEASMFSEIGLEAHMKSAHNKTETSMIFSCSLCGEIFTSETQLRYHTELHHSGLQDFEHICQKCNKHFPNKFDLVSHLQTASNNNGLCPTSTDEAKEENEATDEITPLVSKSTCPECSHLVEGGLEAHISTSHPGTEARYQCSECTEQAEGASVGRFFSLEGARLHYRSAHRDRPHTCWVCKASFPQDQSLHQHIAVCHEDVVGDKQQGGLVTCRYCNMVFSDFMERVAHTRFNHMVETIDITNTELDEVTMVGGHVIEYGQGSGQIIALHTIP